MALETPTCKKWLKGTCKAGADCQYSHKNATTSSNPTKTSTAIPPAKRNPAEQKERKQKFKDRKLMKNSGKLLSEFDLSVSREPTTTPIEIKDFSFVASYNWSDSDDPVIFVPGCPARWDPPTLPYQVPKDKGQLFIDQNSHRTKSASFDPFFKALLIMHPNFDMNQTELTTDRNSIRKLLQFVSGKVSKSWRIEVDVIEDTLFFTRWEESQIQIITVARDSGYGHEFEKAFLSFDLDLKESSGHHRIVQYSLGGIKCLVRFEVDGYVGSGTDAEKGVEVSELDRALSGLQVQNPANIIALSSATDVRVINRGRLVNQDDILELKSRSGGNRMQEIIPQLWISQTKHLFVGKHKEGLVEMQPQRRNMEGEFLAWETKNQEHLSALVRLIKEVKEIAKKPKGGQCVLICKVEDKPRVLRMYERNGKPIFLPQGAREKCWGTGSQ